LLFQGSWEPRGGEESPIERKQVVFGFKSCSDTRICIRAKEKGGKRGGL